MKIMKNANETKKEIETAIKEVYTMLKERSVHPSGKKDQGGRWYADHGDLINVREPSRAWPWSQMASCRTKKYVKAIAEKFNCNTTQEIISNI